jgi:Tc toxin complex TcA C-terminal TcB-binding domain
MMRLRAMAADPNPQLHPAPAQWLGLYAILTIAETTKRYYQQWVNAEQAAGVTYWTALKARLPLWRASAAQRAQWHWALAQRSGPPVIDPDLIGAADMVNPFPADPVFSLWQARATAVAGLVPGPFPDPASTADLDGLLTAAIGIDGTGLAALSTQAAGGTDITARLAQLTLTYDAFTQLTTIYDLVAGGLTPLDTEQSAFLAILTQAQKRRLFAQWRQEETSKGILAGPDEFALQRPSTLAPVLPPWRPSASDRQAWLTMLQARTEQQDTTAAAVMANADAAEGATLTRLRDALTLASHAPGVPIAARADWLTQNLMIDAETGGSVKTTRIEQAIETLQDLMTGLRAGQIGALELRLSSAPAAISYIEGSPQYDIFAVGPGQALWHKYSDGSSWSDWENLGGILTSAPAVASQTDGTVDVFATSTDNAMWHLSYSQGVASGWTSLGGLFHQGPAAGTPEIDSIDVFGVGLDDQLWQRSGANGGWAGAWQQAARVGPLPAGGLRSAPTVVGSGGSYDVFVMGGDSALWHTGFDGAAWSGWTSLGGTLTSAPSATDVNGPLEVFARFNDNTIRSLTAQPNGSFQGSQWTSLAGYATQGPGALAENNVFTVGTGGVLYHKWLDADGWHGWDTTTPLSQNAPHFDAEWTWMGSYATWRAAILVFLHPENILDPALRDLQTQTPGFQQLIDSVQGTAALTPAKAAQFAGAYDQYFRDVCSLDVTLSCAVPPVPPGSPVYLFGIAATSNTAYWSRYDPSAPPGYAQTFWATVPGLNSQQLTGLGAATSLIDAGTLWVLLVVTETTPDGPALAVLRYNTTGDGSWDTNGPYPLSLRSDWTAISGAALGYQGNPDHQPQLGANPADWPPYIVVALPDGSQYQQLLNDSGTGWDATSSWTRVGTWESWAQATTANVSSGQQLAAVSAAAGRLDLFWVDYSADGSANTISTASADLTVSGGKLGSTSRIDNNFTTWHNAVPGTARGNYQPILAAVSRATGHVDLVALAMSGAYGANQTQPFVPTYGSNWQGLTDVWWTWRDDNLAGGQWQAFQRISSGVGPPDGPALLGPGGQNAEYAGMQVAAVARGNVLHVFVLAGIWSSPGAPVLHLYTNWTDVPFGGNTWQRPWRQIPLPGGMTDSAAGLTALSPDDNVLVNVTITESSGNVYWFQWTDGGSWGNPVWHQVNPQGPASIGEIDTAGSGAAIAETNADAADFFYLATGSQNPPVLTSRVDYSGVGQPVVTVRSLGGGANSGAYGAAPIAAVARGQGRVEIYAAGPGPAGTAIWTKSTGDPADAAAWSAWTPAGGDDDNIGTLTWPWSVTAVSQQPVRTDLFAALYGGTTGDQGGIYTTYWQDASQDTAQPPLPPFAVPAGNPPLDIPAQLSSPDLQTRAHAIQAAFGANAGAPASTLTYLQEAYYFVPVYLANQLELQGQYQAALDWYRTAYDYAVPEPVRDIYYGLLLEESLPTVADTLPAGWLLDPLNPHAIAGTRRDAYTRYTVLQIVRCLFDWADALFTTDTAESDAQAKGLYLTGLELLSLDIFSPLAGRCEELLIPVSEIFPDPEWAPLVASLTDDLEQITSPAVLAGLVPKVTAVLSGKAIWPERFAKAHDLIATAQRTLPAPPTVGDILNSGATLTTTAYSALLSVPTVDTAATAVSAATAAALTQAADGTGIQTGGQQAAQPHLAAKTITHLGPPLTQPPSAPHLPPWFKLPVADFWFCIPANPVVAALRNRGKTRLQQLRNGMNIAGQARQLAPYSAPTDPGSGLPASGPGSQLDIGAPVTLQPTPYPYATLIARAQTLVSTAETIEGQMLAALQQRDQDLYEELQARQNLAVTNATVQLQTLTVQQAADSVTLAQLQQQSAQMQAAHWQQMLGSDIGSLEQSAITALSVSRDLQIASAAASVINGVAGFVAGLTAKDSSVPGAIAGASAGAAQALSSAAAAASTQASINTAQASYETQQADWQFQFDLATESTQIAGQQIQIATDQQAVAGQQLVIAQLQASNAADTLNFLANKFTNAPLYDWMASVLQGVYSFFLQQATAVALLAENQLAFERQQPAAGYIKSNYWQPSSANLVAASTPDNTMGLTGAEQLNQDINKLDQKAFLTNQRQLELTKTISLAQLYPVEFQQLRQTGVMNFATTLAQFDQDYPGHYLRLIQQVSTTVIALVPPGQNINATLYCTGVSQAVIGSDPFQTVTVRTDPQSVAITTPIGATGVFAQDPQSGLLLPFQELGVATQWQFSMPLAANQFDFATLADVQITINYTALADPGYRAQVIQSLNNQVSQERPYSFVNDLPDQWYDLNNPGQTPTPMIVQFDVAATDFPANLSGIEIQQIVLYFAQAPGQTFEVNVSALQFFPAGSPVAVGGAATTIGGVISTRRGNAPAWIPMIGSPPFGTWQLTLPDTAEVRGWFTNGLITDILFDISYIAKTPPWPA